MNKNLRKKKVYLNKEIVEIMKNILKKEYSIKMLANNLSFRETSEGSYKN